MIGFINISRRTPLRLQRAALQQRFYSFASKLVDVEQLSSKSSQNEIADALRPHFNNQTPVLLKWPNLDCDAIRCWTSMDYLVSKVGEDIPCLVEIGGSYGDPTMERPEITFGGFIQYMNIFHEMYGNEGNSNSDNEPNKEELIYLAQNDLFDPLHEDFELPALCRDASYNVGKGHLYNTMIWFGPKGCISPLHFDPLDNLLMQFVGRKKVILFPASGGDDDVNQWHYAGHEGQQKNTSPIDLMNVDLNKFPHFRNAPIAIECLLEPGDILYIPKKFWHHVTSVDTSISVNSWWR